ncbi:hypothetical protein [Microbulbifer sp. PSTR4-B]|uniref:hypothetical protein n=1 Tax=unclassified Microbulbifer TaxID=2619833 RepID=UPI00403A2A4D
MKPTFKKLFTISTLIYLLAGCGGGSSGGGDDNREQKTDNENPSASILFPSANGLWSDRETLIVRGSATDNVGVENVLVNGIEADSDDGFKTWQVEIPLTAGETTGINVEVTDVNGNRTLEAAFLTVNAYDNFDSYRFCSPLAYDDDRNVAYTFNPVREISLEKMQERFISSSLTDVVGAKYDAITGNFLVIEKDRLLLVDRDFNVVNSISETDDESLSFGKRPQISIDDSSGDIYVQNYWPSSLIKVDPATGEREKISEFQYVDGSSVGYLNQGLEIKGGRFFVLEEKALLELNPFTWAASEISGKNIGAGESFYSIKGLSVDLENNKAYVGDHHSRLFEIDLTTGDREVISSELDAGEENLNFDSARNGFLDVGPFILINSCLTGHTFSINKESGERSRLSRKIRGDGPLISASEAPIFDQDNNRIIVLNDSYGNSDLFSDFDKIQQVISVDLQTGHRSILSGPNYGEGIIKGYFNNLAVDDRNGNIYAMESVSNSIVKIDPNNGNRTIISGVEIGVGENLMGSRALAVDSTQNRILTISGSSLIAVDIETGNRSVITDFTYMDMWHPQYISLNSNSSHVYISDVHGTINKIDLNSQEITTVSGKDIGSGPSMNELGFMVFDELNNQIIIEDYNHTEGDEFPIDIELLAVDLETGDRTLLLNLQEKNNEDMLISPVIDTKENKVYLAMPNRSIAVFDMQTKQYLTVTQ